MPCPGPTGDDGFPLILEDFGDPKTMTAKGFDLTPIKLRPGSDLALNNGRKKWLGWFSIGLSFFFGPTNDPKNRGKS
jgi:hypothetical protein